MSSTKDLPSYTFDDLRQHMKQGQQWCIIHGKVYDITKFIPNHPGGALIRTALARDATCLYEQHHNLVDMDKVNAILEKYCVGVVKDYVPIADFRTPFATTMLKRCREAVKDMPHRDSLMSNTGLLFYYSLFLTMVYFSFTTGSLWLTAPFGLIMALGHLIGHAGNHWSLSSNDSFSSFISLSCTSLWGLYEKNWEFSHVISHHCYNYTDRDYVMEQHVPRQYYRTRECDPWKPIHAYQHYFYQISGLFAFVVGGMRLDCAPWIFVSPLLQSLRRNAESIFPAPQFFSSGSNCMLEELKAHEDGVGPKRYYIFYEDYDHLKSLILGNLIWLPLFLSLWRTHGLLHAVLYNTFVFGFQAMFVTRVLFTQHVCEGIKLQPDYKPTDDWYAMQVEASTTIQKPFILLLVTMASCYQIEHHMFPAANPAVLLKLQPIVQQTAKEFGVTYHYFPSEAKAMQSVYNHFKTLSTKPLAN